LLLPGPEFDAVGEAEGALAAAGGVGVAATVGEDGAAVTAGCAAASAADGEDGAAVGCAAAVGAETAAAGADAAAVVGTGVGALAGPAIGTFGSAAADAATDCSALTRSATRLRASWSRSAVVVVTTGGDGTVARFG
jgi:hypothetical protein